MAASPEQQARVLLESATDESSTKRQRLATERAALTLQRKEITKELKKEQQKRKRLMTKAKHLSTDDLLQVVVTRAAQAKAKAAPAAPSAS